MKDLLHELLARSEPPVGALRGQVEALAARLGAVTEPEAHELYRAVAEGHELPEMADPSACLVEPLVLFGPEFVIGVVEDIRRGAVEPPVPPEPHVELLPEFWDDREWDYGDGDWNHRD